MSAATQVSMDKWKAAIICTGVGMCLTKSQEVPAVRVREIPAAVIQWLLSHWEYRM